MGPSGGYKLEHSINIVSDTPLVSPFDRGATSQASAAIQITLDSRCEVTALGDRRAFQSVCSEEKLLGRILPKSIKLAFERPGVY